MNRLFSPSIRLSGAFVAALFSLISFSDAVPPNAEEVQILVKPKASMSTAALHAILSSKGAAQHDTIPALNVRIVRVPAHAAANLLDALKHHPDVQYAEPDFVAEAIGTANDPLFTQGSEWHLEKIQAPSAWDISTGADAVVVAVVDSGVQASHPDLAGKVLTGGYDFIANDTDPTDENGHGTAVAGTIAPASNNSVGVAGVAWTNPILPVRVLGADGTGSYSAISNGIIFAADHGARIINMSLGGTSSSQTLQDAVNYAWNKRCVLIAAAGNNGNDVALYPGACNNVVAVSATDSSDLRPSWSNYGSYVDVCAPGVDIATLYGADQYGWWSGTSFSCPVTSGVVALMASANPQLSNTQLVELVIKNSDDIGAAGYDVYYGYGRVNAFRATATARNTATADVTVPLVTISSPTNGSTISGATNVNVSATDNVGVSRIELYVDGTLFGQAAGALATFSLNTLNYVDGTHTVQARAYDAANNVGITSISVAIRNSFVTDQSAPTVTITSPTDGSRITSRALKIYVSGSDNVAITKLEVYLDGKLFGTSTASSATFNWNTMKATVGSHKLQAFGYDAAGNVGVSALLTVWK
jgi:subtilisin family serine protease